MSPLHPTGREVVDPDEVDDPRRLARDVPRCGQQRHPAPSGASLCHCGSPEPCVRHLDPPGPGSD